MNARRSSQLGPTLTLISALALLLCFGPASRAFAQGARVELWGTPDASAFPEASVVFELRLPSGELSDAISAADVRVTEDGRTVSGALEPAGAEGGTAYLFVVDTSGSMRALLPEIRSALATFVEKLGTADRAALIAFNDQPTVLHPFSDDRAALKSNLDGLVPGGTTTNLYYAVTRGVEQFRLAGLPPRKVLVAISDGKDEGTAYTLDDCIAQATGAGVTVVGLGVTTGDTKFLLNLERLSEKTRGFFTRFEPGQDWAAKVALVERYVRARRRFRWTSTLPKDGKPHAVRLDVSQGGSAAYADFELPTPLAPPPPSAWTRWQTWAIGLGLLAVAGLVGGLVVRSRKAAREKLQRLEEGLEDERRRRDEASQDLDRKLEEVKGQVGSQSGPGAAAVGPAASGPVKRRTVFVPGGPAPASAVPYRIAALEVREGPLAGARLPLLDGRTTLGREDDNNIVLDEGRVSLHHAVVVKDEAGWWLEDLRSTNGTFLRDGSRVAGRVPLVDGEQVRLGQSLLVFRGEA